MLWPLTLKVRNETVAIVRRWDPKPAVSKGSLPPGQLHNEIDVWLSDPVTRRWCVELWRSLPGSDPGSDLGVQGLRLVRDRLWKAFRSGELVAYARAKVSLPSVWQETPSVPRPQAAEAPSPPVPSPRPPIDVRPLLLRLHMNREDAVELKEKFRLLSSDGS